MNIQIRIQVPKPADAKSYDTDVDVAVITDPEIVRDVLIAIFKAEARIAARIEAVRRPITTSVVNVSDPADVPPATQLPDDPMPGGF